MSEDAEYGLLVSFTDQSPSYTHGFEAGMIWQRMQDGEAEFTVIAHTENREVIERMAMAASYSCYFAKTHYEEWVEVQLESVPFKEKPEFRVIDGGVKEKSDV